MWASTGTTITTCYPPPTVAYGVVLLMAAIAYVILQQRLIAVDGAGSVLRQAIGSDWKGKISPVLYVTGIALAFWRPWAAQLLYALTAMLWLIPDRRIESAIHGEIDGEG